MKNRIRELRNSTSPKITQKKLDGICSLKQGRISSYETEARAPSLETARRIASALLRLGAKTQAGNKPSFDDVFPPEKEDAA